MRFGDRIKSQATQCQSFHTSTNKNTDRTPESKRMVDQHPLSNGPQETVNESSPGPQTQDAATTTTRSSTTGSKSPSSPTYALQPRTTSFGHHHPEPPPSSAIPPRDFQIRDHRVSRIVVNIGVLATESKVKQRSFSRFTHESKNTDRTQENNKWWTNILSNGPPRSVNDSSPKPHLQDVATTTTSSSKNKS